MLVQGASSQVVSHVVSQVPPPPADPPPAYEGAGQRHLPDLPHYADLPPSYEISLADDAWQAFDRAGPGESRLAHAESFLLRMQAVVAQQQGSPWVGERVDRLLKDSMVDSMTRLVPDGSLDAMTSWIRCRSTAASEYVGLVTRLIDDGLLSRERAAAALLRSGTPDQPPFLHKFASFSRPLVRQGRALAELIRALAPTPEDGAPMKSGFRKELLKTADPRGLPDADKYGDFFSRLVRDGHLYSRDGRPFSNEGALACLGDLAAISMLPTPGEVAKVHSRQRAAKFERAAKEALRYRQDPQRFSARTPPHAPSPVPARSTPPAPPAPPAPPR